VPSSALGTTFGNAPLCAGDPWAGRKHRQGSAGSKPAAADVEGVHYSLTRFAYYKELSVVGDLVGFESSKLNSGRLLGPHSSPVA